MTFNNHAGSTRSYDYVREHNEAVSRIDFITGREEITATIEPGQVVDVEQHDGTVLRLRKLHTNYDPTDRVAAMSYMHARAAVNLRWILPRHHRHPHVDDVNACGGLGRMSGRFGWWLLGLVA